MERNAAASLAGRSSHSKGSRRNARHGSLKAGWVDGSRVVGRTMSDVSQPPAPVPPRRPGRIGFAELVLH